MTDDIVMVGITEEKQVSSLTKVIQHFAEQGLTVNDEKCQIKMTFIK